MSNEIAFIGDIHGNIRALRGLCSLIIKRENLHMVFLGDYINKGPHSFEVIEELLTYAKKGQATLLAGNHELALLKALNTGNLSAFLRIGGAMTIQSYVGTPVGADAFEQFKKSIPKAHLQAIYNMTEVYETDDLIAQHYPSFTLSHKFQVSAHIPVGKLPRIEKNSAQLDTGCGTHEGRLTALLWPSRDYLQVSSLGTAIS